MTTSCSAGSGQVCRGDYSTSASAAAAADWERCFCGLTVRHIGRGRAYTERNQHQIVIQGAGAGHPRALHPDSKAKLSSLPLEPLCKAWVITQSCATDGTCIISNTFVCSMLQNCAALVVQCHREFVWYEYISSVATIYFLNVNRTRSLASCGCVEHAPYSLNCRCCYIRARQSYGMEEQAHAHRAVCALCKAGQDHHLPMQSCSFVWHVHRSAPTEAWSLPSQLGRNFQPMLRHRSLLLCRTTPVKGTGLT